MPKVTSCDKRSIRNGTEFEHKPITTVLYFFLYTLLYVITLLYLPNTLEVMMHLSPSLIIPSPTS